MKLPRVSIYILLEMASFFDQFDAKSDGKTTVPLHTKIVIIAAFNLLERLPIAKEEKIYLSEKLFRCAVLHDIGKIHPDYQKRVKRQNGEPIRHEIISLWFCENFLDLPDDELFAIGTHHKGIYSKYSNYGRITRDVLTADMRFLYECGKNLLTEKIISAWLHQMGLPLKTSTKIISTEISKRQRMLFDNSYQQKAITDPGDRKKLSYMRALLIAADHIGSARMENDIPEYKKIQLTDFQPIKNGIFLHFREFQKRLQKIYSDVIVHAPTGSGKTEAAACWIFANQTVNARVFYVLPNTASINAMTIRFQNIFGEGMVTALHSKTLDFFYDQLSNEDSNKAKNHKTIVQLAKTRKSLSNELFYPVKVTTLYQILKTSLKGKGWEMALYDYKNSLFIIDEFHTYDALFTGMLLASVKLFRKLFNAKFLFMSATIPDFMMKIISKEVFDEKDTVVIRPDEQAESDRLILNRKRHQLYCKTGNTIKDDILLIKQYLKQGRSVLVIVNNVKTAQDLYKDLYSSGSVALLHGGLHEKKRNEIEKAITNKKEEKRPRVLIATQAVEVSLNIDYDVAFIENSPIDALIQRLGRINRVGLKQILPIDRNAHIHYSTVPIYLYENSIGRTPFYNSGVLKDTWQYLSILNGQELSENDLMDICNKVYEKGYNENQQEDFLQGLHNTTIQNFESDWVAGDWNDWIEEIIENNNQKIDVLCANLVEEFDKKIANKQYIEANQLLVQVYQYEINGLIKHGNVIIANNLHYDEELGYYKKGDK